MAEGGHLEPKQKSDERIQSKEAVNDEIYKMEQLLRTKDLQLENTTKRHNDEIKKMHKRHNDEIKKMHNSTEEHKRKNEELKKENEELKKEKDEKIKRLKNENEELSQRVQCLLQCLENEGKICAKNCTVCAITWICKNILGHSFCGFQLMLVMVHHVAANITIENLMCVYMMNVIIECKVIDNVVSYIFPEDNDEKLDVVNEMWKQLQNMGERVCIIGTKDVSGIGHCVVSYLEDGTVKIYDPQNNCPKMFADYINDDNTKGLRLHFVNKKNLEGIIKKYGKCLHRTDETYEEFRERLCALSDLRYVTGAGCSKGV